MAARPPACGGLAFDPRLYVEEDLTEEAGARAARTLLEASDPPTGIVCGHDTVAPGVMRALGERGKSREGRRSERWRRPSDGQAHHACLDHVLRGDPQGGPPTCGDAARAPEWHQRHRATGGQETVADRPRLGWTSTMNAGIATAPRSRKADIAEGRHVQKGTRQPAPIGALTEHIGTEGARSVDSPRQDLLCRRSSKGRARPGRAANRDAPLARHCTPSDTSLNCDVPQEPFFENALRSTSERSRRVGPHVKCSPRSFRTESACGWRLAACGLR